MQKRLASKILKVGESRVWLDPSKGKDIEAAITKTDIRKLIQKGYVKAIPPKIKRHLARKESKGLGRRKGKKYSVIHSKRKWISTIRPLRRMLKEMKMENEIDNQSYRKLYRLVKGGMFRSRSHLRIYMEQHGLLKKK